MRSSKYLPYLCLYAYMDDMRTSQNKVFQVISRGTCNDGKNFFSRLFFQEISRPSVYFLFSIQKY